MMEDTKIRISVNAFQFDNAVRTLPSMKGGKQTFLLNCVDGHLNIAFGDCSSRVKSRGAFTGIIKIKRRDVETFAQNWKPNSSEVELTFESGYLKIGSGLMGCTFEGLVSQSEPIESQQQDQGPITGRVAQTEVSLLGLARRAALVEKNDPMYVVYQAALGQVDSLLEAATRILEPLSITKEDLKAVLKSKE